MRATPVVYELEHSVMVSASLASILLYEWNFFLYFPQFFAIIREVPYSRNVKNSIGNDAGSIKR